MRAQLYLRLSIVFLLCVYALIGTGKESLLWGAALLAAGLPVYLWMRGRARL